MKTAAFLLFLSAALLLSTDQPVGADARPRYRMTVLPLLFPSLIEMDAKSLFGGGINSQGQIVGLITVRSGKLSSPRTALWQKGRSLQILDKTPITADQDDSNRSLTFPTSINTQAAVAGGHYYRFSGAYSGGGGMAYVWRCRKMTLLRGFPMDSDSLALGINDIGEIVGNYTYNPHSPYPADPPPEDSVFGKHAFLIRAGHVLTLWPGIARSINNHGQIVGTRDGGDYTQYRDRGVLWRKGHITLFQMQPVAINERGEIAGNIPLTEDSDKACLWRKGRITRLSHGPSHAYALNNHGQVVGEQANQAVVWQFGRTDNLNRCVLLPKGWHLESALGINDKGWIIGEGSIHASPKNRGTVRHFTFLLTPR